MKEWRAHQSLSQRPRFCERITISFNLMFASFTENLSKPLW
jgi:hypothetical protein